jgi:hypothetical protein
MHRNIMAFMYNESAHVLWTNWSRLSCSGAPWHVGVGSVLLPRSLSGRSLPILWLIMYWTCDAGSTEIHSQHWSKG